ncbi:MAG: preprotein translocase subunit YajC [Phycisphaeraceae bacterium]
MVLMLAQDDAPLLPDDSPAPQGTEVEPGTPGDAGGTGSQTQGQGDGGWGPLVIFFLLMVVLLIFMMGGQRREKKRRTAMLQALDKGDKIQTVGGILGTIVEVRDDEIVVKVDENTNTRLRLSRSAIQSVLNNQEQ